MKPSLVERWESLPARRQAAVAFPVAALVMFVLHLGPFDQPLARAIGYAVFWGAILTGMLVVASRAEKARRDERERRDGRGGGG